MYPTRTTSTTGTLRVLPAAPAQAPLRPTAPAAPVAVAPVAAAPVAATAPAAQAPVSAAPARAAATTRADAVPTRAPEPAPPEFPAPAPVAEAAWSEVPAARARAGAEPVHAPAGGDAYVPAPAVAQDLELDLPQPAQEEPAHAGVATLRLRSAGGEAAADARPVAAAIPHPQDPAPYPPAPPFPPGPPTPVAVIPPAPPAPPTPPAPPGPPPEPVSETAPGSSGVPGPGVAEIVALAVARGMEREEQDGTQDLPPVAPRPAPRTTPHLGVPVGPRSGPPRAAPHPGPRVGRGRGTAVTEVPAHLPFGGAQKPPAPAAPAEPAAPAPRAAAPARPVPGRRVPRGDDRLREHRGPVLPGWIGVVVGGIALTGCAAVLWRAGAFPAVLVAAFGAAPRAYQGLRATHWPPLAFLGIVTLLALGGLGRAKTGHAWVLTLFGRYRGTVRRTGLTWVSPLLLRRRVDVRLRHWRSDPMPAVDSGGLALQVVVQVVWQVKDTARATLAVADHVEYLAEQVESAMARVLSQLPADAFHEDAPTLRDAEAVGDALTRMLAAETEAVGIEVFSAQPTRIEYAPEVAEAMRRRRVAAIDAKHRDAVLSSVVDAVDDTVHRLTSRGLVELDDYERKALVKDLTVAFYTGRSE
ncbi:SPFH domain-containing protein [Streptomyces sp. NPDC002990]